METLEVETVKAVSIDGDSRSVIAEAVCPNCSVALYDEFVGDFAEYHEVGGKTPWDGTEVCVYVFPDYSTTCTECGEKFTVTCDLDTMLDEMADELDNGGDYDYEDYRASRDRYEGAFDHPNY